MRICIAGKNEIAIYGIELLLGLGIDISNIVFLANKNDFGIHTWQPSFKKYCFDRKITMLNLDDLFSIKELIFVSLEYDQIIETKKFVSNSLFNIHFSLLPAYKGMYTSLFPILHGENYSGVTLHKIDDGIDTGDIIDQIKFEIPFGTSGYELYLKYLKYSKVLLKKNLINIINLSVDSYKQPVYKASYFSKKSVDFNNIDIQFKKTCFEICNFINAFSFRPYQMAQYKVWRIVKAYPSEVKSTIKCGTEIENTKYLIRMSTIDYDVILLKDNLDDILNAASVDDIIRIKYFHTLGYSFNEKNSKGWNALIVCCYNGSKEVFKYLVINFLCDINDYNNNGTSVLMYAMTYASRTSDLFFLKYLIDHGADILHKDYSGKRVKDYALEYGNQLVIDYLNKI